MKKVLRAIRLTSFLGLAALTAAACFPAEASKPWPKQLKDLESVNLYIHLPSSLNGREQLGEELRPELEKLLLGAGVEPKSPDSRSLAIDVDMIPMDVCEDANVLGIRLLLRLSEPVVLLRNPKITEFDALPIVWSDERLFAVPSDEAADHIKALSLDLMGEFVGWIRVQRP